MDITRKNVGDVLCLYSTAECICITDVKNHHTYYDREYGSGYMTPAQTADAFRVTDPERLSKFDRNCSLGKVLLNAELAALGDLLSGDCTEQEIREAGRSLENTRKHQKHLYARIEDQRTDWAPGKDVVKAYLSDLLKGKAATIFWGRKVEPVRGMDDADMFSIDGHHMNYDQAISYLGNLSYRAPEQKIGLDAQIHKADSRRLRNPLMMEGAHDYRPER